MKSRKKCTRDAAPAESHCCRRARLLYSILYLHVHFTWPTGRTAERENIFQQEVVPTHSAVNVLFVGVLLHLYVLQAFYEIVHCLCVHDK